MPSAKVKWLLGLSLFALFALLVFFGAPRPAAAAELSTNIYLPVISSAAVRGDPGATATPSPTPTPMATPQTPNQGARWLPYRRSDNKVLPTYGASVAVDAQGGIHAAYSLLSATNEAEGGTITYAYCPANCTLKANWSFVHLGDGVEARIQVDAQGHPRLVMMTAGAPEGQAQHLYFSYGVCDTGCTDAANWTLTPLVHTLDCIACVGGREQMNHQYFALDPAGHPAFVFPSIDPADDSHAKLYYFSCMAEPAACSQTEQWVAIQIGDGSYPYQPSLVFAGVGQPRLAYQIGNSLHSELYYLQCDQDCQAANWTWQQIAATSTRLTVRFSLAVNGRINHAWPFIQATRTKRRPPLAMAPSITSGAMPTAPAIRMGLGNGPP
jgi:hypothetical protein